MLPRRVIEGIDPLADVFWRERKMLALHRIVGPVTGSSGGLAIAPPR